MEEWLDRKQDEKLFDNFPLYDMLNQQFHLAILVLLLHDNKDEAKITVA